MNAKNIFESSNTLEDMKKLYAKDEISALDLFMFENKIFVLTLKVSCPKCGHVWGIHIDDYDDVLDIPDRKFRCTNCDI